MILGIQKKQIAEPPVFKRDSAIIKKYFKKNGVPLGIPLNCLNVDAVEGLDDHKGHIWTGSPHCLDNPHPSIA